MELLTEEIINKILNDNYSDHYFKIIKRIEILNTDIKYYAN